MKNTIVLTLDHIKQLYGSLISPEDCSVYDAHNLSENLIEIAKIEGLIEFMEILDCGNVGGYGYNQDSFPKNLAGRLKYLTCKYIKEDISLYD